MIIALQSDKKGLNKTEIKRAIYLGKGKFLTLWPLRTYMEPHIVYGDYAANRYSTVYLPTGLIVARQDINKIRKESEDK